MDKDDQDIMDFMADEIDGLKEDKARLEAELHSANTKIEALNKLIQIHQTYQTKQGDKS